MEGLRGVGADGDSEEKSMRLKGCSTESGTFPSLDLLSGVSAAALSLPGGNRIRGRGTWAREEAVGVGLRSAPKSGRKGVFNPPAESSHPLFE